MEARVAERLVYLALLSGVLCVEPAVGKYVKGIVDTKEVSTACAGACVCVCFFFNFSFLRELRQ